MTSSATRRKQRRQAAQQHLAGRREEAALLEDSVFGWQVRPLRGHAGTGRWRLRWVADSDPYLALTALTALRSRVLDQMELMLVAELRDVGTSWEDIGWCLEVTGEAARKRHSAAVDRLLREERESPDGRVAGRTARVKIVNEG